MEDKIKPSPMEVTKQLREIWDNYSPIHERLIDIAMNIEIFGECGEKERNQIEDLKSDCEDIALALSKVLEGEANAV